MAMSVETRLSEMGVILPEAPAPAANYVPFTKSGNLLTISGQLPKGPDGLEFVTQLKSEMDIEAGQGAARLCAINILSQAMAALGDLDRIVQLIKIQGFVNAAPDFTHHADVVNGASDFLADALGDAGKHARIAIGCSSLPFGVAVEVDAMMEFR